LLVSKIENWDLLVYKEIFLIKSIIILEVKVKSLKLKQVDNSSRKKDFVVKVE